MQYQKQRLFAAIYTMLCCLATLFVGACFHIFSGLLLYSMLPLGIVAAIIGYVLGYRTLFTHLGQQRYSYGYVTMLCIWVIGAIFIDVTFHIIAHDDCMAYGGCSGHYQSSWWLDAAIIGIGSFVGLAASFASLPMTWLGNQIYKKMFKQSGDTSNTTH